MARGEKEAAPCSFPRIGQKVKGYCYAMEIYLRGCVDKYCNLLGIPKDRLKKAQTPFIDEAKDPLCRVEEEVGGNPNG